MQILLHYAYNVVYFLLYSNGEEITSTGIIEDTKENREDLLNEWSWSDSYFLNDKDSFINGSIDSITFTLDGGDYDEPTGREIIITTYETKKEEIERRYKADMEALNSLFGISINQ